MVWKKMRKKRKIYLLFGQLIWGFQFDDQDNYFWFAWNSDLLTLKANITGKGFGARRGDVRTRVFITPATLMLSPEKGHTQGKSKLKQRRLV